MNFLRASNKPPNTNNTDDNENQKKIRELLITRLKCKDVDEVKFKQFQANIKCLKPLEIRDLLVKDKFKLYKELVTTNTLNNNTKLHFVDTKCPKRVTFANAKCNNQSLNEQVNKMIKQTCISQLQKCPASPNTQLQKCPINPSKPQNGASRLKKNKKKPIKT